MALTITSSSYAGKHAGLYVNAALNMAKSLEYMTVRENVNYKEVINRVSGANLVKDASCDFTENSATLTTNEQVLFVEPFQINIDVCKSTMISDWAYEQQDDFVAYAMTYLSDSIADSVESSIWTGTTGTSGQFDALSSSGMASSSASGAYTAANIVANLQTLAGDIPAAVYGKDDLYIYMNKATYRFYISAISALSAFPFNHMGQYTPEFEGIKIAVCPGVATNTMWAGTKSNAFFGTSLNSDLTEVKVLDMADLDGSNNIRMVARWTAGVQVGVPADFTKQS
ncbi:MAG: hypothetical protein GOVbin3264_4 [Prokaryotic dsDNA virus sp.]|nr:MAG: hypothetical protein GOVbin3264_4 [Prokaryotic dsDNA virus sp.]|tara:strand:- start:889 stop:1740 length:852 start_codon:yes stop_codon:yes gene_type:complete